MGRTVASSTSTTRLAFSCMTPMRIHVLYCVSMKNRRTMPITDVPLVAPFGLTEPDCRLCTGTGAGCATCSIWPLLSPTR